MPPAPPGAVATAPPYAGGYPPRAVGGERAGFGIRLGAWLLDGLLYGLVAMAFAIPGIVLIVSAFSDCSTVETGNNSWEIVCPPGEPSGGTIAGGVHGATPIGIDRFFDASHHPDDDLNPRRLKCGEGIGTAIAREDDLRSLVGNQLGRLNPRTAADSDVRVLDRLKAHVIEFDDQKALAPAKARVDLCVQAGFCCRYSDLHQTDLLR